MCGIAGYLDLKHNDAETAPLQRMADSLAHRGPDGEGIFTDRYTGLAHRRLSIMDLSEKAHQPMTSTCGRYTIVFNGEIYNYQELRRQLMDEGASFTSTGDTEVILWAWQLWGPKCFARFNGMWTLAIWDSAEEELLLCRDRLSVKPLYTFQNDDVLVFASEVKGIIASGFYIPQPDLEWFHQYLTTSYATSGERTFFRDVRLFPQATWRIYKKGRLAREEKFWQLDVDAIRRKYNYADPVPEFERLIRRSVELRLRSDTPVGTCLSGGLDSSSLVGIATSLLDGGRMHSFTSVYEEPGCNEKFFAQQVAAKCNTRAHYVYPTPDEAMDFAVFGVNSFEAPISGPTLISQLNVMRMAHGYVKVLIDGQGSDEMLAGYEHYYITYLDELHRRAYNKKSIPKSEYKAALHDLEQRPHLALYLKRHKAHVFMKRVKPVVNLGKKVVAALFGPEAPQKLERRLYGSLEPMLESEALAASMNNAPDLTPKYKNPFDELLTQELYSSFFVAGIPTLLLLEDANSMAFSIEARTPFMDYEFVEFCFGLDMDWKIRGGTTKYIQRQALDKYLPEKVKNRKDKMGYPTPYATWLRGPLKQPVADILFSEKLATRGILNVDTLHRLWDEHQAGTDWSDLLYKALSSELWFRVFIDGDMEVPDMRARAPLAATEYQDEQQEAV